jgi:hypothetical protein
LVPVFDGGVLGGRGAFEFAFEGDAVTGVVLPDGCGVREEASGDAELALWGGAPFGVAAPDDAAVFGGGIGMFACCPNLGGVGGWGDMKLVFFDNGVRNALPSSSSSES